MAQAQDDLDRLLLAWQRLQTTVNYTLPQWADRLAAARGRMTSQPTTTTRNRQL